MIITTTPTIQDGQVLRWYLSPGAEDRGQAIASASRNAVLVNGRLEDVEPVLDDARRAHQRLVRGEDVTDMATHRTRMFKPAEPIVRAHDGGE